MGWACRDYVSGERAGTGGEWASVCPNWAALLSLDPKPLLELPDPVAGDAELRVSVVFQPDQQAVDPRIDLLHRRDVDDSGPMDADEAPRIEVRVQFRHREVDHMFATAGHRKGQLVFGEEVRDASDVEHRRTLADA